MKKRITMILVLCIMVQIFVPLSVNAEVENSVIFNDIAEIDWYYDSVNDVVDNGLMKGTSSTTFSPDMTLSRAMCATILYRMAGEPEIESTDDREMEFADVKPHEWYTDAVLWAHSLGIVNGVGENNFAPGRDITRAELVTMMFRYVQKFTLYLPVDLPYPSYADGDIIPNYAEFGVTILSRAGIINGKDGNIFDPQASATRAEAAALFSRFTEKSTTQDFSLLEKLGARISVNAYITGGYASPTVGELWLGVIVRPVGDNMDELKKINITMNAKLYSETSVIDLDLERSERFDFIKFGYSEMSPDNVNVGDEIYVDVTVSSEGMTETYRFFITVAEAS